VPDRSARDASNIASSAGSGSRTPSAWLEARSRAIRPIPQTASGRRGSRTLKAHRSPGFEPGAVALRLALPSRAISSGGRNRTCVLPVNSRALVPARAPPESSRQTVGMAGFEPALSCSRSRRIHQAFPHPESLHSPTSAQRESNPHIRHGKAVGYRYIMGTIAVPRIVKEPRAPGGTRTHVPALRERSLRH
jgi:hypothetical protein